MLDHEVGRKWNCALGALGALVFLVFLVLRVFGYYCLGSLLEREVQAPVGSGLLLLLRLLFFVSCSRMCR